jgi:hypothetical protein
MIHINYGLAMGQCSNVYSVFFSNAWETISPFTHSKDMELVGGRYLTFPTGKNYVDNVALGDHPATWPVELDFTDNDDVDIYLVSGSGAQGQLDLDAFRRYLAYWLIYYPVILRNVRGYNYGSAGNTSGAYQGHLKYFSNKDDAFVGKGAVWAKLFGLTTGYTLADNLVSGWGGLWHFTNTSGYLREVREHQTGYAGITDELWQELAVIRSMISREKCAKAFKSFPFSSRSKQSGMGRTLIHEGPIRKLSYISQMRYKLDTMSRTEIVPDKKCPLCTKELILPKVLAERTFNEEIMCVSCGFKALNNIHYLSVKNVRSEEDNCMWFTDIDMDVVLHERTRVQVAKSHV